jgi:nicotinamide-nucleotide amidase
MTTTSSATGRGQAVTADQLFALAAEVGAALVARKETVAVAESSAGGLISAALLAVPGASAYFRGGGVVYTVDAKSRLLGQTREAVTEPRAATEAHAVILARAVRDQLGATWGVGETGASGPTGNRYGDPPGHACVGVAGSLSEASGREGSTASGPSAQLTERAQTVSTGSDARLPNMYEFAFAALSLLRKVLA